MTGLSIAEATARLAQVGANALPAQPPKELPSSSGVWNGATAGAVVN